MSEKLKVLVVDDSALYRQVITDIFKTVPQIEVVGMAENGVEALERMDSLKPDLVTLDIEMPVMDGLRTLEKMRSKHPGVKTLLISHYTEKGAELTIRALNLGADDFVTKPTRAGSVDENLRWLKDQLLPRVRQFVPANKTRTGINRIAQYTRQEGVVYPHGRPRAFPRDVIAIGLSTGGPKCLSNLFRQLPSTMKQAILIVQHMPPLFTKKLADQLNELGTIPAHEAEDYEPVERGKAYIAPGDYHMTVQKENGRHVIRLNQDPPENYCRPAVDVLFRSVAKAYGRRALGVVLTGMGKDGLNGSRMMKEAGAPIIAQDKETSVIWGMPGQIVEHGLADAIAPIDKMYNVITSFIL